VDDLGIRPYRDTDADAVRDLRGGRKAPRAGEPGALVAELGGTVVGSGRMTWWDENDGTRLYLLTGRVAPAHRGRGVGRELLARQEQEAVAHLRDHPHGGRVLLGGNADAAQPDAQALLLAAGYRVRFTVVDLAQDLAARGSAEDAPLPHGVEVRPVRPEHHPLIHRMLEECFADSGLGGDSRTYEQYQRDVRDVDLWQVAWDAGAVAGVVVNERAKDGSVDSAWVAVVPPWRRRGLAKALLLRSLRRLAGAGVGKATIRTVRENGNQTVGLYESVGYRVTELHPRYAKPLPAEAAEAEQSRAAAPSA
jgi:mycothiol synthase